MNPAQMNARLNKLEAILEKMMTKQTFGAQLGEQTPFMSKRRDFYIYEAHATVTASGTGTDTIQIEADSNFILEKMVHWTTVSGLAPNLSTATTILFTGGLTDQQIIQPNMLVQITDTGSGRNLMSNPIPIPSTFGSGKLPFILPHPRIFLRNTTIQISFTNADTVNGYVTRLAFIGYKVYGTV